MTKKVATPMTPTRFTRRSFNAIAAAAALCGIAAAHAQQRVIHIVVPFGTGAVQDTVAGVSCGCADVFGAREEVEKAGFDLITDNSVPGTSGLPSIAQISANGYTVFTF